MMPFSCPLVAGFLSAWVTPKPDNLLFGFRQPHFSLFLHLPLRADGSTQINSCTYRREKLTGHFVNQTRHPHFILQSTVGQLYYCHSNRSGFNSVDRGTCGCQPRSPDPIDRKSV